MNNVVYWILQMEGCKLIFIIFFSFVNIIVLGLLCLFLFSDYIKIQIKSILMHILVFVG